MISYNPLTESALSLPVCLSVGKAASMWLVALMSGRGRCVWHLLPPLKLIPSNQRPVQQQPPLITTNSLCKVAVFHWKCMYNSLKSFALSHSVQDILWNQNVYPEKVKRKFWKQWRTQRLDLNSHWQKAFRDWQICHNIKLYFLGWLELW